MWDVLKAVGIWSYLQLIGAWQSFMEQLLDRPRQLTDIPDLSGQVVIITGGNRGIGWEAVKKLLSFGCRVIMGCRRPDETIEMAKAKLDKDHAKRLDCFPLDMKSMTSVKKFARLVGGGGHEIHCLINNAGIMFGKRTETEDGLESQMATNYFGHFLLTSLLLPQLKKTANKYLMKTRVVNVSSAAHYAGSWMNLEDLNLRKFYSEEAAYSQSKAAQLMFTKYLNFRLKEEGSEHVMVNAVHPGVVKTDLFEGVWLTKFFNPFAWLIMKTPEQGGRVVAHAAVSPSIREGGLYLQNFNPSRCSDFVRNEQNQEQLWNETMRILGMESFGVPR